MNQLESQYDWHGAIEVIESAIASAADPTEKARLHLDLGRILHGRFLRSVKALKHFQDAFKLNPARFDALAAARQIYWELAKLNMVEKLLELELRTAEEPQRIAALQRELAESFLDRGMFDRADDALAKALQAAPDSRELADLVADSRTDASVWQERIAGLLRQAHETNDAAVKAHLFLRAARIAGRFEAAEVEGLLGQAFRADPTDLAIAARYETIFVETDRLEELLGLQREIVAAASGAEARAARALTFGSRWATRHGNAELASEFLEECLRHDPTRSEAFLFLRDFYGTERQEWVRVLQLANQLADRAGSNPEVAYLLAQGATVAWRELNDVETAQKFFARLVHLEPKHAGAAAFARETGQSLTIPGSTARVSVSPPQPATTSSADLSEGQSVQKVTDTPVQQANSQPLSDLPPTSQARAEDSEAVATLRRQLESQEAARRPHEYVKTLVALGDELTDPREKAAAYQEAAELYSNKFSNQAEAVKTYEKVLDADAGNQVAVAYLRDMYEKRRDWEKLIQLNKNDAARMEPGPDRLALYKSIAQLATDRVKKPEVCIELWDYVLREDDGDADAIAALSGLHERAKDYQKLADTLEKLARITVDEEERVQVLTKLGQIAGERLKDDDRAAEAYRQLLILRPDDRRAQEQLKKRYIALGRWDDLEQFYSDGDRWDEFIRVLESNESRAKDLDERLRMLMKVAELWMTQKGKPDRAARAYEKVLQLDAKNLDAAERLVPIYTQANNSRGLSTALEVKLEHAADADDKLTLLRELGALYESRLNDKATAFERYLAAFQLAPAEEQSQRDVGRAAKLSRAWDRLVEAYERAIGAADATSEVGVATALRLALGGLLVRETGQVDAALQHYREVYEAEPDNAEALAALESLYRQTEKWRELLDVYAKKRELANDPDENKAVLFSTAKLYREQLGDAAAAIETYLAVLEEDPADAVALEALDELYQGTGNWQAYAETLLRRIELDPEPAALVELKFRLGQTQEKYLDDEGAALENYREILEYDTEHAGARQALEGFLGNAAVRAEAARILQGIFEERGEWEKLIGALEILASGENDTSARVAILRRVAATAAHQLRAPERAIEAQARALKEDPTRADTRDELEAYVEQANAWKQLIRVYQEIASALNDPELARDYWVRLASIHERLNDVTGAAECYEKVLALDPGDGEALQAMDALYRANGRWDALIQVFRRRIDLAGDAGEREGLYAELASVYEDKLAKPDEAIAAYQEVLSLDPGSQLALKALDGLFSRRGMWAELAENIETQLELADAENVRLQLMLRLSSLQEREMNQIGAAVEGYRHVLDQDPSQTQALQALERLQTSPEHALAIAEILEPFYRSAGEYQKLIGVHEIQVARAEDTHRKVELLHQIAQLHEDAAGDTNAAFESYARALACDPANDETLEGLDRLARATGRYQDLAGVFEELAASQKDPEVSSQLYASAARVFEDAIGDTDRAVALYRKVLSVDPVNRFAAEALETLFEGGQRYSDKSLILQRKAEILDDIREQKAALFEAAKIEEVQLNRPEAAIGVYQKVLALDAEDIVAVDRLIDLYVKLGRWEELLGVYAQKADLVSDTEEKKLILYQVGPVYERELGNVARAIDTYQRVLELDPDDLTALQKLDVLYQAAQNWPELLSVLTREAELTSDAAEAVSHQYRIGELYEKHLDDTDRAVDLYRDILHLEPGHRPTLEALERIKNGQRAPVLAAAVLEPVYEASGLWEKLSGALEVQAQHAPDSFSKIELLHRIARLHEESLADPVRAFETYARAVEVDSRNEESLGSLERLALVVERWPAVAALYDRAISRMTDDPGRSVELGVRVAQIYEVQLEDIDNAIERYQNVLKIEPDNQNALRSLDRLFQQSERWLDLARILRQEADTAESPDEILEFKCRLGRVYQSEVRDLDKAIEAYREVIAAAPEHAETLEALESLFEAGVKQLEIGEILEPLYQSTSEWEKLLRVREAQLEHLTELDQRLALYHHMAQDAEERLLDPALAFSVHVRAIKEAPLDESTGTEIERIAGLLEEGWEDLANAYADVLGIESFDAETHAFIGTRLARVFEEELGDVAKAEETYRYVLTLLATDNTALANLDRIYSSLEQWADLAAVLERRVTAVQEKAEKVDLNMRLGALYEERLEHVEQAIAAYRRVFDELESENEGAIAALGRIYEQAEAWTELKGVYERELENAAGDAQEAEIRAKLAQLTAEHLGDVEGAVAGWKRVLDLRGEDPEALWALGGLYEKQGKWAELTDVLERNFDIAESDTDRVNVLLRRARLFNEELNRDDEALETWQRVLDIDFSNVVALQSIAAVWRKRQNPEELVRSLHTMIDRAAALLDAEDLTAAYRELGKNYGSALGQPIEAEEAWRNLLDVDAGDFEAMDELERYYRAEERWTDVIDVKMRRAGALAEPEERIQEFLEVTNLWRREVGEYDRATAAFGAILEIDPGHTEAFAALEKLHTAAARWEQLIELYLNRLETRETVAERSELLRRIARIFEEQLNDKNQAFDALLNAFSEDFGDDETAVYLERMAQATNRWTELISSANEWLKVQDTDKQKIRLCLRLGKWYGEDLGHPDYAQPYFRQVNQMDPNNVQVLRQMAAIERLSGNWPKVGQTLQSALDAAVANEDRKQILVDLGELLEKHMAQPDQGIPYYKRALEIDSLYLPALDALERIYEERGEHAEYADILKNKANALKDDQAVAATKLRLGGLLETKLGALDRAAKVYREVIAIDASNLFAMRGLERVVEATQSWGDLVQVLEQELEVVEAERDRVEVLLKLATVQEERFLKFDVAARRLEQVLEIFPAEERAYVALARCYRHLKQWLDLINTYERHINETISAATKVELYRSIADVYADIVGDVDLAISAYQRIVDIDETNIPALEALSKLYEKRGETAQAIEAMTKVADLTSDGRQRVEAYFRIGRALEEKLNDRIAARERFEMALDLEPQHLPTLGALRRIAIDEQDWEPAARYLDQEQRNTESPRVKAKLLVELGRLREEMLSEHELAIMAYEQAIENDADCEEAALPLVEDYITNERWQDAAPLAAMLVKKSKNRERAEQQALHKMLGKIEFALKNFDKALKSYQAANQLDLSDQDTIRGIANSAFELQDWATALTNYQKVLTALAEGDVEDRTEVYYRLGRIKREQGQARQAINNFEKALALQGEHRPTLEALIALYFAARDFKQVAAYKRQVLDSLVDGEARYTLLLEIGDLWAEQEKNPTKALEAYEEALELKPQNHILLHKLLQNYQSAGEWHKMIDTLESIARLEEKVDVRARYIFTQAQICRDKLEDLDRAVQLFNEALDLNPKYLEAFERINKVLTQQRNWKQLERSYRKMLHRVAGKGDNELEHNLWHQLGIIYRDRLKQMDEAIESFRMAASLREDSPLVTKILAELYEVTERWDQAIVEQQKLLEAEPLKVDAYRALYRLRLQKQEYDEAWCLAAAMAFLRKAEGEELRFFEDYRAKGILPVKGRLGNDQWAKALFHKDENLYISKIFEMIAPAALQAKVGELRDGKKLQVLDKRFKQDPATSTVTFAKTFGWVANVLGIQPPELYVRNDVPGSILAVTMLPPSSVAGQTVLTGFQPQELTFICGKHLNQYRGEHYIRTIFPTQTELTVMLFAGVMLASPTTPMPPDMAPQIRGAAQALAKFMAPQQLEGLRVVVKRFIEEGAKANIKRWNQAVELTGCRAGLLVCGDLEIAKTIIAAEPQLPGELPPNEKMKDLLLFSVSDRYSLLRKALGINVGA